MRSEFKAANQGPRMQLKASNRKNQLQPSIRFKSKILPLS